MDGNVKTNKKIEMTFSTDLDTTAKLSVSDPLDSVDAEVVSAAMETIVGKGVLMDSKGNMITAAKSAKMIETTERTLF